MHVEENPNVKMRPSYNKLITKLRRIDILKDPDVVVELIHELAYKTFVY